MIFPATLSDGSQTTVDTTLISSWEPNYSIPYTIDAYVGDTLHRVTATDDYMQDCMSSLWDITWTEEGFFDNTVSPIYEYYHIECAEGEW